MVRIGAFLLLGAMIWLGSRGVVLAQEAGGVSPLAAPIATDPAKDAALKTYLQKHFKIPSPDLIKLGPAFRTPIEGLFARQLIVSNEQGQNVSTSLFFDKNETKAIIGQYIDTSREPWGRTNMGGVSLDDRPTQGPANAPVTIVEFADFECPFCAHAFSVIETLVNTTYKGKVKVIFKAYPLNVHPWAMKAAEAAECARMQNPDAFWDFARYFYTNQGSINAKNIQDNVDKLAKTAKTRRAFTEGVHGECADRGPHQAGSDRRQLDSRFIDADVLRKRNSGGGIARRENYGLRD